MDIEGKIELLNSQIAPEIIGENVFEQRKIDTILKENGNEQTSFAISLAVARAAAAAEKFRFTGILEVYVQYIQVCRSWSEKKKLR